MRASLTPTSAPDASGNCFFNDAVAALTQLKATQGQIYLLDLMNSAAATSYLQVFFQPSLKVTLGTTVADLVIKLPTNAGSGFVKTVSFPVPVGGMRQVSGAPVLGSGLTIAGTTTPTGSTTVAIGVTAVYT